MTTAPGLVVDHEAAQQRRMMRMVDPTRIATLNKQVFEINTRHPILKKLFTQKSTHPVLAKEIVEQVCFQLIYQW